MTDHADQCEYRRTAVATALWCSRGDRERTNKLIEGCDDAGHLLQDQAIIGMLLLKTVAGHHEAVFTTSNLAEIAVRKMHGKAPDEIASEVASAHLASAVLALPGLATMLSAEVARWAAAPLAYFTCSVAAQMTGGDPEKLLERMSRTSGAEELVDVVTKAAGDAG